jgi:hypothetical protein
MIKKVTWLICLCVSNEVMYHILDLTTLKEVWDKLKSQYISKTLINKLFAEQWLYNWKMYEWLDSQHVNVSNNMIADLVRFGVKIDDKDKVIILLCSFPGSYDHLVATLTYEKDSINIDVINNLNHSSKKISL